MPPAAIIDISSDSDDEPLPYSSACSYSSRASSPFQSQSSSMHEFVMISDSDDDEPIPSSYAYSSRASSLSQSSSMHEVVTVSDDEDEDEGDDDLPAPSDPAFFDALAGKGKRKRLSSDAQSSDAEQYSDADDEDDEEESPKKVARKASGTRKPRKSEEEKAALKTQKQAAAAAKKAQKAAERAQKAAEKAEKAAELTRAKKTKKTYLSLNKLVPSKTTTLSAMHVLFPPTLSSSPLLAAFRARVAPFATRISVADTNIVRGEDVFSWERTARAVYDQVAREWVPFTD
ncbi:hypothetical protein B0H12DRAFT_1103269, partial [Mycena haematopus]